MSDRMDPKLRELTYRLVEMAPEAPPFPEGAMVRLEPSPAPSPPTRRRRFSWAAVAAGVALIVIGVPLLVFGPADDTAPTTIPPASVTTVPDAVVPTTAPDEVAPTTVTPMNEKPVTFAVYLFSDDMPTPQGDPGLVAVERTQMVDASTFVMPSLKAGIALHSLLTTPPEAGYTTAIPPDTELIIGDAAGGDVVVVDLTSAFESGGGTSAMFARLAQVVFTATQVPEVDAVRFMIDGEDVEVFSSEGLLLDGPQTRADYLGTDQLVYVDAPAIGASVGSPFTIRGHANAFEGTVEYEITLADGTPLTGGFATTTCGSDCWGEFAVDVEYVLEEDTAGFVSVFETSAVDGARRHVLSYPVTLLAAEWSGPPEDPAVPAAEGEIAIMDAVAAFALSGAPEDFAAIPLAEEVGLGLGWNIVRTVPAGELVDPEAWVMDIDLFRARAGTTSIFDLFEGDPPRRTVTGDHLHCASPPVPPPAGFGALTRISTQPTDATSCLEWFTVDLFVDDGDEIVAITIDLYEP